MPRWVTLCLGAVLFVQPAAAGIIDERVFSAFEALCLDNISEIGRVPSFAGAIGMVELSGEKARLFLDGHPGRAWISAAKETARYALILTDEGSCGVTGPDANGKDVLALFLSNSRNQRLSTEKIGSSASLSSPSRIQAGAGSKISCDRFDHDVEPANNRLGRRAEEHPERR
jgi:hypothetical protein